MLTTEFGLTAASRDEPTGKESPPPRTILANYDRVADTTGWVEGAVPVRQNDVDSCQL
jgi:hypothetical protein